MTYCPKWKWYLYPRDKNGNAVKPDYVINSAITGSIERVIDKDGKDTGLVNIATDNLKERGQYLQCAIADPVKDILEKEAEGQTGKVQHYGLIIVTPGKKLSEGSVVQDFISFHRDSTKQTVAPAEPRSNILEYNKVFEELLVLEQAQPSTRPPVEVGV